jgi:hypothetical protein
MKKRTDPILITFITLRRAVGLLGIFLPVVLVVGLMLINCCPVQDSISQFYYTRMGSYLTGTLCAVGLFLFAYQGYPGENDGKWCNFAAVCAFGVAFIPMPLSPGDPCLCDKCIVFFSDGRPWWRIFHFISAALLFGTMAYLSYSKFTKSNLDKKDLEPKKKARNVIYRICGIIIFACIIILAGYNLMAYLDKSFHICVLTFIMESIMLIAFGFSWLVKGEGIPLLNDKKKAHAE